MRKRNNGLTARERRQQIELCASTFFRMNGRQPEVSELVDWLDRSYLKEIAEYLHRSFLVTACA